MLRDVGRIEVPGAKVTLRMSQGVHSGRFHFFAVGTSHLELLPVGPAWSRLVAMEHAADAGEIVVSPETAALLPSRCLGEAEGAGMLLRARARGPHGEDAADAAAEDARARRSRAACRPPCARTCWPAAERPSTVPSRSPSSASKGRTR